tara:strand:+ start:550 stop:924 length:375 start_codon:yes stop_codon:yes gene_type:complete
MSKAIQLPKIGDLIYFTDEWDKLLSQSIAESGMTIYGVVYKIANLSDIQYEIEMSELSFEEWNGYSLAYPLSTDSFDIKDSKIYFVRWMTKEDFIITTYKLINEEWFYHDLFAIFSESEIEIDN